MDQTPYQGEWVHPITAIRYGGNCFITRDRGQLAKSADVAAAFNDFKIMTPEKALVFAHRVKALQDFRMAHPLPE